MGISAKTSHAKTGKAAELLVANELLRRNIDVFLPLVDTGIDLICLVNRNPVLIQVKASRKWDVKKGALHWERFWLRISEKSVLENKAANFYYVFVLNGEREINYVILPSLFIDGIKEQLDLKAGLFWLYFDCRDGKIVEGRKSGLDFSDLHGNSLVLKMLKQRIEKESYDCMLIAGDLTNADFLKPRQAVKQIKEVFSTLEQFKLNYYYVWGSPFREGTLEANLNLVEHKEDYLVKEQNGKISLTRKIGKTEKSFTIPSTVWDEFQNVFGEISKFLSSLTFGKHLENGERVKVGQFYVTSHPKSVAEKTILMRHHYRKIVPKALLQLDGHLHFGQQVANYLNLGFLYRDSFHNAPPLIGCFWKLIFEGSNVHTSFVNLDKKLKEFRCEIHPEEGTFYIPFYWKRCCPVCNDPRNALIKQ
jgi:predicted MPP superfamily phosphohydrolase